MKIGYYPGCSLTGSSKEYNESVRAIAKKLDIELVEVNDWNCCGATAAHSINKEISKELPLRILNTAKEQGLEEVLVPCAACYNRLFVTNHEENNGVKIINVIEFINKYAIERIKENIKKPFAHKVACYYGCLLIRPHNILKFDRVEDPQTMDIMIKEIGGETIDWGYKTECCGAGLSVSKTDAVTRLCGNILTDASDRDAKAIIVACPMCHSNLDMRRNETNKTLKNKVDIPVLFITQAIGLALGMDKKELGLNRHFVTVNID